MHLSPLTRSATALPLVALLTACGAPLADEKTDGTAAGGCVEDFEPGTDHFPDKVEPGHAENISFEYGDHYVVVTVEQPAPGADPESYLLHRCGTPEPEAGDLEGTGLAGDGLDGVPTIEVPVESVFSGSTTHLPLFTELDRAGALTGVSDASFVSTEEISDQIEADETVEYAGGGTIDQELVIAEDPDLLMTGGTEDPGYESLREAGVPVVANAEWLEATPLGRAEWLLFAGVLTGQEQRAAELFAEIESDYDEVAELTADADPVQVLPGQLGDGSWFVPAGGSYVGRLLADAGATHPWDGTEGTESVELDLEEVLAEAREADVWVASADWDTLADAEAGDERHTEFAAFATGQVWTNNKAIGPTGGNQYWDEGVLRPDLVLADLVHVVHPDLLPDHETRYYRQLDQE
ncbi:ABC transporter substrate-binding protein [Nocardiopsis kunsanensis]|uniref:ABC transporter substrate-binding protein n=1 Tax=Nocardiopsis kunsanensis TaxID=141693 RepID=A0A918XGJ2_9ACTN|nr:ABC transporter substrate-binding protein [Nocardiopsis kunsanensis]GHD29823.1 ABC transporter substrate-binding protein [Nocardiopsis kunsanensis]